MLPTKLRYCSVVFVATMRFFDKDAAPKEGLFSVKAGVVSDVELWGP